MLLTELDLEHIVYRTEGPDRLQHSVQASLCVSQHSSCMKTERWTVDGPRHGTPITQSNSNILYRLSQREC